jgi:hypothetical protein
MSGISLGACSSHLPVKPITDAGFEMAAAKAKLLIREDEKFDEHRALKGENANAVLHILERGGYTCRIGYLNPLHARASGLTFDAVLTPLLFCKQGSADPSDFCAERHVNLEIGWRDPKATEQELRSQLHPV